MKKLMILFMVVGATALIFSSCGKYEEGPAISLLSKTSRITGEWVLDKTFIDDVEQPADTVTIEMEVKKDGTGEVKIPFFGVTLSMEFEWEFDDTKENLRMRLKDPETEVWESWEDAKILMLKSDEMWLETEETDEDTNETVIMKQIWVAK